VTIVAFLFELLDIRANSPKESPDFKSPTTLKFGKLFIEEY